MSPVTGKFSVSPMKSFTDFIYTIKNTDLKRGRMVSFDVDSLFTIVPIDNVLSFLSKKLSTCIIDPGMPVETFLELVKLYVTSNDFPFRILFTAFWYGYGLYPHC